MRNTKDQWLIYDGTDLKLMRYTDFNFQLDHDDSKSMLGYVFILNEGAIYWKSFKQHTVADSICEAEYIAASDAAKEACSCRSLSPSLELHPLLMVLFYCIMTTLEP